jgi:murein DD-endopeptidase MepM/ murein hydrolase activator NlpD
MSADGSQCMSSHHHDRLLGEGTAPADPATVGPDRTRRTADPSTAGIEEKSTSMVPPQRQGKAQSDGDRRTTGSAPRTAARRTVGARAATAATGAAGTLAARARAARSATPTPTAAVKAAAKAGTGKVVAATAATTRAAATKAAATTKAAPTKAAPTKAATSKAAPTKAATTKAAPTKAATSKAVPTKAATSKAATTKAAPTKAAPTKVATAVAVTPQAVVAVETPSTTVVQPTPSATPAPSAEREAPSPARRQTGSRAGGRHRAETPAARATAARAALAQAIAATIDADTPVSRRPTPFRRSTADRVAHAPVADVSALVRAQQPVAAEPVVVVKAAPEQSPAPAADPAGVVAAVAQGRGDRLTRRPSLRRRPVLCLAAALIGAFSISGASAAPTEVRTQTVSHSVSVAEQLGIAATPAPAADEEVASRLGGLVTSRNERDAERTAAADAQAQADRLAAEEAARIAAEAARPKAVLPVEGARLTSGFGARWGTLHPGIDLAAPMRTPERAAMDGVVLEAGAANGFGLVVYIQHDNGDVTVYGHMDEILVEPGQIVRAGDVIALLGNRGQSTGPHLHFEVHVGGLDGEKVDPLPWLRERGVQI